MKSCPIVVEYLKTHSFQQLEDDHGVCVRFSNDETKASLNYDQTLCKSGDKLAEQCRGLIIRPLQFKKSRFGEGWNVAIVGDVEIVAWPLNRFYNLGDPASTIDWNCKDLRVVEKLDGTMIIVYFDDRKSTWYAGTRSIPEADVPLNDSTVTFSQLFWDTLRNVLGTDVNVLLSEFSRNHTYVFELTTPVNRIVVDYKTASITLLAIRDISTGNEYLPDHRYKRMVPVPTTFNMRDPEEIKVFVNSQNPSTLEGVVVIDNLFNRVKIKSQAWVLSSRLKSSVVSSRRTMMNAIIDQTIDDALQLIDEKTKQEIEVMTSSFKLYVSHVDKQYTTWKLEAGNDRKRFAELVNVSSEWATPYFQLYNGHTLNMLDWLRTLCKNNKLTPSILDCLLSKIKDVAPSRAQDID